LGRVYEKPIRGNSLRAGGAKMLLERIWFFYVLKKWRELKKTGRNIQKTLQLIRFQLQALLFPAFKPFLRAL